MKLTFALIVLLISSAATAAESLPGSSIYHLNSRWLNQHDQHQTINELAGRPRLFVMVFTGCQSACPMLVRDLKYVDDQLSPQQRANIAVDLFSFDSEKETALSMKSFLQKYKVDGTRWTVHSAAKADVTELAAVLGLQYKKMASGDYIHSNILFLVNKKGEIVAKKEGLNTPSEEFIAAVKKLAGQP